jgi:hypothetical protein
MSYGYCWIQIKLTFDFGWLIFVMIDSYLGRIAFFRSVNLKHEDLN